MKKTPHRYEPCPNAEPLLPDAPAPVLPDALVERLVAEIPAMRAFARSLCNRADADRACEQTLMKLSMSRDLSANDEGLRIRLYRLLRQHCREALARQAASPARAGPLGRVAALPVDVNEAFALVTGLGMSLTEAGLICECPPEEIARRLAEARARLSARTA